MVISDPKSWLKSLHDSHGSGSGWAVGCTWTVPSTKKLARKSFAVKLETKSIFCWLIPKDPNIIAPKTWNESMIPLKR